MLGIKLTGSEPIYEQIANQIKSLILMEVLEPNESLPSVRELATELTVNPNTVQKAYTILEQGGVTYSVTGKGRFVTDKIDEIKENQKENAMKELKEILTSLQNKGISKSEILDFTTDFFERK